MRDAGDDLGRRRVAAQVRVLAWWIRPDHQELCTCTQPAMAGAGGQQCDIAGLDRNLAAVRTAEQEPRGSRGEAERLVRAGVIVMVRVDAVAPGGGPAVAIEHRFEARRSEE